MEYVADLHMHSKYAMACSEHLTLENMDQAAKEKGIGIVGTGDFTHPRWLQEIKPMLKDDASGMYTLKGSSTGTRFVLSSEVCTIFEEKGRYRKIHNCILAPSIEVVEQINAQLSKHADLSSDGRPALNKLTPAGLVEIVMGVSRECFVFPAHLWTPWFGALGAFSGFNSIEEAYQDQAKHIHAYETGLSSDPPMNWQISKLDKYTLISGSDAHSLPKMAREAIVLDMQGDRMDYGTMTQKIKDKQLKLTIEFYPQEGKYHFDGHRNCNISLSPEKAKRYNYRCPKCAKPLTIGVLHRVSELADRQYGYKPAWASPYAHAIPLQEVIAYVSKKAETSAYVKSTYQKMVQKFGTELNVLLKADTEQIRAIDKDLARAIELVREDRVNVVPGYDGVFGVIDIFNEVKSKRDEGQQKRMTDY